MAELQEQHSWADRLLRIDFLAGVVVGLIAIAIWAQAWNLPTGEIRYFGPGFLPKTLGSVVAVGAVALMVWGLIQPPERAERLRLALRGPVAVATGIVFFACFIRGWQLGPIPTPQLGLLVVAPVTVVLTGLGTREANIRELLVLAFGITALVTLLFSDILGLQIPLFPRFLEPVIRENFGFEWPKRFGYGAYLLICLGLARAFGYRILGFMTSKGAEQ